MRELNAIFTIALRDFTKLIRDRVRLLMSLVFPLIFIGIFGGSFQSISKQLGFDPLPFVFTGVFAQVLFQSTASGIISLIEDRENDFSQEIFVSPISRYTIIFGKILGETLVSYTQVIAVVVMSIIFGVSLSPSTILVLLVAGLVPALFGGAFGTLVLANLGSQRSANQLFPFLIFPQFFLSGIFTPIKELPPILLVFSRLAPMTYAVDFIRSIFYLGKPEYSKIVVFDPLTDFAIMAILFVIFLTSGTYLFVKNERNR
ncbi:ABC transporter permease [Candidatus Daviesbacteria bacterium]|nr:ABC transporter permease [Candidatus Daviesbacteria bacterium]